MKVIEELEEGDRRGKVGKNRKKVKLPKVALPSQSSTSDQSKTSSSVSKGGVCSPKHSWLKDRKTTATIALVVIAVVVIVYSLVSGGDPGGQKAPVATEKPQPTPAPTTTTKRTTTPPKPTTARTQKTQTRPSEAAMTIEQAKAIFEKSLSVIKANLTKKHKFKDDTLFVSGKPNGLHKLYLRVSELRQKDSPKLQPNDELGHDIVNTLLMKPDVRGHVFKMGILYRNLRCGYKSIEVITRSKITAENGPRLDFQYATVPWGASKNWEWDCNTGIGSKQTQAFVPIYKNYIELFLEESLKPMLKSLLEESAVE